MLRRDLIRALPFVLLPAAELHGRDTGAPRIGFLGFRSERTSKPIIEAFQLGLREEGFEDGRNVSIAFRWAGGDRQKLARDAADLAASGVRLLVGGGAIPALAVKRLQRRVPLVFLSGGDPVALGLTDSFSRPSPDATGVALAAHATGPKLLELLAEFVPANHLVGALFHDSDLNSSNIANFRSAAASLDRSVVITRAGSASKIVESYLELARAGSKAIFVGPGAFFADQASLLVELGRRHKIPAIYSQEEFVDHGGLVSYGPSIKEGYRWVGIYVGRALKGVELSALPVMPSSSYDLIINLSAAKELEISIPPTLLALADEIRD